MEHLRLELSSEQTLRLEELRQILAEALPPDAAEMVSFPTAYYATCGGTCFFACDSTCWGGCRTSCWLTCQGHCWTGCTENFCQGSCTGTCVYTAV
jgi:hypothetical protein